jgi:hypothetical protein
MNESRANRPDCTGGPQSNLANVAASSNDWNRVVVSEYAARRKHGVCVQVLYNADETFTVSHGAVRRQDGQRTRRCRTSWVLM